MNDDERKPKSHIHIAGIIIFVIVIIILFKVDIKEKIQSPQFQKNITYVEEQAKDFYNKYITKFFNFSGGDFTKNIIGNGVEKMQSDFSNNVLKTVDIEKIPNQ